MLEFLGSLGTLGILRKLFYHWELPTTHPVYRYYDRGLDATIASFQALRRRLPDRRWWWIGGVVIAVWVLFNVFSRAQWGTFISATCGFVLALPLLAAVLSLYFLPAIVALLSSSLIVAERERQTWDLLLTTPLSWDDLLLARLARLLRGIASTREFIPGIYLILAGLACLFAIVTLADRQSGPIGEWLEWLVIALVPLQFVVERVQDFVLASLIGLTASLLAPNRQVAAAAAMLSMLAWLILRGVIIAVIIRLLPPQTFGGVLILLLTGPASALSMALPVGSAILCLLLLPIAYEVAIRLLFRWLVRHLGEGGVRL
ncbi:MAG: hypothetical protein U0528_08220 [Anaerolineae bacterium]|nr:hypothetical protein [Anaerolineae bacterium]